MFRRNFLFLPRRGIRVTAGISWTMPAINNNIQFISANANHHVEGIRHNGTINNNDNSRINYSLASTVPPDPTALNSTSTIDDNDQSAAENQIIESALNTPIIDLINQHVAPVWNELENSNINTVGAWLTDRPNQSSTGRLMKGLTDQIVKSCFSRQLDEINALNTEALEATSGAEHDEKKQARISAIEGRLKVLRNISLDSLSPRVLGASFQGETVRDWLIQSCTEKSQSVAGASFKFNPYQATSRSISVIFGLVGLFIREHHPRSLPSILRRRYRQLLLQEHRKNPSASREILAGSSHRHTNFPFTGLLGRELLLHRLQVHLRKFGLRNETKERLALFTISSLPRQGKTALLDWIGYDREVLAAFAATEYAEGSPIFVLNMTFNALWHSPNFAEAASAFEFATTQMKLRLLAAGLSKFNGNAFTALAGVEKMLIYMLVASETVASCFNEVVSPSLRSLLDVSSENKTKTVLLFDEFSNIEPRRNSMSPVEFEKLRESIYSAATELIDHNTLVVVSGFTTAPALASRSGRVICDLPIEPVVSSVQSRETLPMRSQFFDMIGRQMIPDLASNDNKKKTEHLFDAPMVVYELAKTSLGVLGAILECGREDDRSRLSAIVKQIPFLTRLKEDHTLCEKMVKILKYKSFQFLPSELLARSPLFRSMNADLVDAVYCSAVFTDGTLLPDASAPSPSKALGDTHIEPLFLAHALETSGVEVGSLTEFPLFLQQLARYSDAVVNPIETAAMNRGTSIATEFGRFPQGRTPAGSNRANSLPSIKNLTSSVFENVVLTGILFQRQLRHSLFREKKNNTTRERDQSSVDVAIRSTVDEFLAGASKIVQIEKHGHDDGNNNNNTFPPTLYWTNELPSSSTIRRFNSNRTPYPHLKANTLQSETKLCQENFSFSLDSVHIPQRPESNPLADIIFHEQTSSDRLAQFWIDTKHSDGDPMPGLDISDAGAQLLACRREEKCVPTLILDSLNNPLLQDPKCSIDHVVHIIVTSWSRKRQRHKLEDLLASSTPNSPNSPLIRNESQILGRLASYSLFYVRPEDLAFENLVSEPIKLGMPLLEEVDADTWAQKLPEKMTEWPKYKAVKRDPSMVMHLVSDADADFEHLRNLAFVEDCAMTMLHSAVDSGFTSKALVSSDQDRLFKFLPFGTWLDALGALPRGWNAKPFFKKATLRQDPHDNETFEFAIIEAEEQENQTTTIIKLTSDYVHHVTQNAVTIGHLFHNRSDMARRDSVTDQLWDSFIDSRCNDESSAKNLRLLRGILWTTTLKEWNEDIKFSTKLPKLSALLKHEFASKSVREIIKELEDSTPRKLKSIRIGENTKERINVSKVIQQKVDKILEIISVKVAEKEQNGHYKN